ncbi:bifunctional aminoglycoside phosphotransferase/ATP-binding protein [Burkholderia stagnalis]|uniref:bifunctional aminoglycoside phosphotransferase/ATP-binding protein n=1 Tax=Burkholderia stagnalis TaxID=1503054 RepID=UPI0009C015D3|nr:bifunctional aminoglycoside phosphotransferase/ATP-binding protein [Burkholderia stagnalis]
MPVSRHLPHTVTGGNARRNARSVDRALQRAATYAHPAGRIRRIETHLSIVYLAGRYAYKIIKPVKLGFVDLTRAERRRRCAQAGCTLNRPLAGPLYLGVQPLVAHGRLNAFGSDVRSRPKGGRFNDASLEYVVRMRRFDADAVLSARCRRHDEGLADADALAAALAHYHLHAPRRAPHAGFGSAGCVTTQCLTLLDELDATVASEAALRTWIEAELERIAPRLDERHQNGFVRACHGDLHLDNIVRWRGRLLMFDCIEFDDTLRWIDVASDLSFALMDYSAHGRDDCAHRLLAGWLALTGDHGALDVLPFFKTYRALVRALAARLRGDDAERTRYVRIAMDVVAHRRDVRPCLLLCHGVSGSGKSVASLALAGRLDAIRLSSDVERKRLAGCPEAARLPDAAYSDAAIDGIYDHLLEHAKTVLESGHTAIVDATFLHERNRAAFIALANRLQVRVIILAFSASPVMLHARVAARAAQRRGASDADTAVLAGQFAQAEPLTDAERALAIRFDTGVEPAAYEGDAFWSPLLATLADDASSGYARRQGCRWGHVGGQARDAALDESV